MPTPNKSRRYVYNGTEVLLTGRVAEKDLRRGTDVLYEVKPHDLENGSWRKWVRPTDLYVITEMDEPSNGDD